MNRARLLIEATVTTLGVMGFVAAALGGWILLDPTPDQRPILHAPTFQHAVRRCPAPAEPDRAPSHDAIAALLAQIEEGRP